MKLVIQHLSLKLFNRNPTERVDWIFNSKLVDLVECEQSLSNGMNELVLM